MTNSTGIPLKINHVGFAVKSIEEYLKSFVLPGLKAGDVMKPVFDPVQNVNIALIQCEGGTAIELVEPAGPGGPTARFAESRTGGIYHVCYETDDLDGTAERLRSAGCVVVSGPVPAVVFNNSPIMFLMNRHGDLIELLEVLGEN